MLIFKTNDEYCIFIHIPKNSGKYIRKQIINNNNNKILNKYWGIKSRLDLAHIPYMKKNNFIRNDIVYKYITNTRNPYDRMISAFFYKNRNKNIGDFKHFVKNKLISYDFNMSFDHTIIHYYPQYLFVCDENLDIPKNIEINKLEDVYGESIHIYDLTKYYDDGCLKIINNIYSNDFLFFNYHKLVNEKNCV